MNDTFLHALRRAIANPALLDGFGLERVISAPPLWRDTLSLDGAGSVKLRTLRSRVDANGEPIGEFEARIELGDLLVLLQQLTTTDYRRLDGVRIEPIDLSMEISIVIDGVVGEIAIPMTDPAAVDSVRPLLQCLERFEKLARARPLSTLTLHLNEPPPMRAGDNEVLLSVTWRNDGRLGTWIVDPSQIDQTKAEDDRLELRYWKAPVITPGVSILPAMPRVAPLRARFLEASPHFVWLPPGGELTRQLVSVVSFETAGAHYCSALYASYDGGDDNVGQRRTRGAVFSNLLQIGVN